MLLYALPMKKGRCWVLDLTGPPQAPAELTAPSVYALVVPSTPAAVYVGATKNLRARVRQHLTRSRALLSGGRKDYHAPRSPAAAVLSRVIAGRAGLLVSGWKPPPGAGHAARPRLTAQPESADGSRWLSTQ